MNFSLQRRLTVSLLISLLFAFSLIWLLIHLSIKYLAQDYIYTRLSHDSETLLALVIKDPELLEENVRLAGAVYQQPFSGHYFEITYADQIIYSRSLWDQTLKFSQLSKTKPSTSTSDNESMDQVNDRLNDQVTEQLNAQAKEQRITAIGPMQQPLLVLVSHFSKNNQPITITVAEDVTSIHQAIATFKTNFTLAVAVILALLIALQLWGLRKGLKPLIVLQQDLKALKNGTIDTLTTPTPNELKPVIDEINHLHYALASRLTRYRNALSDLAHALKKPLTVIQQLSQHEQLKDLPEVTKILKSQSENTQQLTQRILNKARLAGAVSSVNRFNFNEDLTDLLHMLQIMYQAKHLDIQTNIDSNINQTFDREDMLELLGNLLDNACKWAKSTIVIKVKQHDKVLEIIISDDGNGIDKQDINWVQQRGMRLDESTEGHGMGLGIVSDIIEHYHAEIIYSQANELGGLQVDIKIPPLSIH